MRYTNQKVKWERCTTRVDDYGDVSRVKSTGKKKIDRPVMLFARKQPHNELIKTSDGRELFSRNIYYIDPSIEKYAMQIKELDLLDNELVAQVYVMCDLMNHPKMVRFITV